MIGAMPELLILGAVIGSNNFATALALGSLGQEVRRWRVIAVFGAFEFCFPLVGLWLGRRAAGTVAEAAGWLGPLLLGLLGFWAIWSAFRSRSSAEDLAARVTSWGGLLALSAGLSLDNLLVGFSLGLGEMEPIALATTIALFSMTFAWLGLRLGDRARDSHRRFSEAGTGLLLIMLAAAVAAGWI